MTDVSRAEKCRVIAEFIEPMPRFSLRGEWWLSDGGCWTSQAYSEQREDAKPADFYTSEAASALALEKMRENYHVNVSLRKLAKVCVKYKRTRLGHRGSRWELIYGESPERKTAIGDAAYLCALKAKEKINGA